MATPGKGLLPDPLAIKAHLKSLSSTAASLNEASDALSQVVAQIEARLNALNVGVEADVTVIEWSAPEEGSEQWRLAYGKIESTKKWGFEIKCIGPEDQYGRSDVERWPFKDAPRDYRIRAVSKIPALMKALEESASNTAREISGSVNFARELARQLSPDTGSEKG